MIQQRCWRLVFVVSFLLSIAPQVAQSVEPWADTRLPVNDGLALWLDASSQPQARADAGAAELQDGSSLDVVFDGSGHHHDVKPTSGGTAPQWVLIDRNDNAADGAEQPRAGALIRFDGTDDHLRRAGIGKTLHDFTIFVVTAPHSNSGFFRGFFATNAKDGRDYESGLTIDMHGTSSTQFDQVNVEGRGFGGANDVLNKSFPFGRLTTLEVSSVSDALVINLLADGELAGQRPRFPIDLSMDEITVGARYYTNDGGPQQVRGTVAGDIAEVLVYDRALKRSEATQVQKYLDGKWRRVREVLGRSFAQDGALISVADPPPVQMFTSGFDVRELPLDLPNINNLRYREDGRLVALAYNGDIYLLSDNNGDGYEDTADLFWSSNGQLRAPIGMALTPPNYPHGQGVVVAAKGKVSLIVDKDGDDQADEEIVVAKGWTELPHGVDALGVAIDPRNGSIYFGLGTTDYTNAYLVDAQGASRYRLDGDRGTIQRVSADLKTRETVCTGIRFPVALMFKESGDLFCTDQEGATWLANGNPFDELLHIQPGRHYGFPPRHPRFLPNVIDEPSTFDYKPQHQSTCGLLFNGSASNDVHFGPEHWNGDAIICGYSRGKLYRTQLAKTAHGYVARSQLLACLNMLPVDAALAPDGELVVAVHSGAPDWGTGPQGQGKLYKIVYNFSAPVPVAAWPVDRTTFTVAFDQPLELVSLTGLAERCRLVGGPHVQALDQYESLHPPYEAVQRQLSSIRRAVPVHAVQLSPDRRRLIFTTGPFDTAFNYALSISDWYKADESPTLAQDWILDLALDMTGAQVDLAGKENSWSGWIPYPDFQVSREWLGGSAEHEGLWNALGSAGKLTITCQLDLRDMLRPKVQPGSKLDYELPTEQVTLVCTSNQAFSASLVGQTVNAQKRDGAFRAEFPIADAQTWQALKIEIETGKSLPEVALSYFTNDDARERALSPQRIYLPWARPLEASTEESPLKPIREQLAGNWSRGKKVFYGDKAQCAKCHSMHEPAGRIGAPLGNLWHRDVASVLRDIRQPNFAINPDFVTYNVLLNDGRMLTGIPRTEDETLVLGNQQGELLEIAVDDVDTVQASPVSTMPTGLLDQLSEQEINDLLTFLLSPPPRMPVYAPSPPAPRPRDEVKAVLTGTEATNTTEAEPLRILLVSGPKDHGPGEHDYPAWRVAWTELLAAAEGVEVDSAESWPDEQQWKDTDVAVFFQQGRWDEQRAKDLDAFLARGGGAVYLHYAVDGGNDPQGFADRIGLAWQGGRSKFRHGALDMDFDSAAAPLIARNFHRVHFEDESYWQLVGDPAKITLIGSGDEDGAAQPLFWTAEPQQGGRVFVSILGHYSWTFDDPLFRILILRGIAWSAGEPVDRFSGIVTFGANVAD